MTELAVTLISRRKRIGAERVGQLGLNTFDGDLGGRVQIGAR